MDARQLARYDKVFRRLGAIPRRVDGITPYPVSREPCFLMGAIVIGGAAATTLVLYDQKDAPANQAYETARVIAAIGAYQPFLPGFAIVHESGVLAVLSAADGLAYVYVRPLTPLPKTREAMSVGDGVKVPVMR